jgi:hypothetical protein
MTTIIDIIMDRIKSIINNNSEILKEKGIFKCFYIEKNGDVSVVCNNTKFKSFLVDAHVCIFMVNYYHNYYLLIIIIY